MQEFDYKKATQAINYFAKASGGKIDKLKLVKLIYFADKYHLRKYGRTLFNDQYFAMPRGPVASFVKDVVEFSDYLAESERAYAEKFIVPATSSHTVASCFDVDRAVFSETDIEALDFALKEYGSLTPEELVNITHEYPEWSKFKELFDSQEITRAPMDYLDFFENPKNMQTDRMKMSDEVLRSSRDEFKENSAMAMCWA